MGYNFRKWIVEERGATAVEFALVAIPALYLLIGIIEMSLMFLAMSTLDYAANESSRLIRTGQVQQSNTDPDEMFRDSLCSYAKTFLDCKKIQYEVVHLDNFADFANHKAQYDENGDLISGGFDAGSVNDVILVRVVYKYKLMTPIISQLLSDSEGNTKKLVTTVVLETEPYDVDLVVDEL